VQLPDAYFTPQDYADIGLKNGVFYRWLNHSFATGFPFPYERRKSLTLEKLCQVIGVGAIGLGAANEECGRVAMAKADSSHPVSNQAVGYLHRLVDPVLL